MILIGFSVYFFLALIMTMYIMVYVLSHGKTIYMKLLGVFCLMVMHYFFAYTMEMHSQTLVNSLFWNYFLYLTMPFLNAIWLLIALFYTNRIKAIWHPVTASIFIIPVITVIARYTNTWHHLYYKSYSIDTSGPITLTIIEKGPLYYLQLIYIVITTIVIILQFQSAHQKSRDEDRMKLKLLITASVLPVLAMVLIVIDPFALSIDFMVFMLPFVVLLVGIAIIRSDFLEIKAVARDTIFEVSPDVMVLFSKDMKILDFNSKTRQFFERYDIKLQPGFLERYQPALGEFYPILVQNQTKVHEEWRYPDVFYFEVETVEVNNKKGEAFGYLKVIRDITKNKKMQIHLENLAKTDPLSQLNNRTEFIASASDVIESVAVNQAHASLLMMDIDDLKIINDTYGYAKGDFVIKSIGTFLSQSIGIDDLSARMGGEEFAILLPGVDAKQAYARAFELKERVRALKLIRENLNYRLTISIGIASFEAGMTLDDMLRKSENALAQAKKKGRNQIMVAEAKS